MAKKNNPQTDASTEERIKEAARKVFTQKGYAATRTRDIAEESGINLALLNYYFRSKEKLFEIVMAEKMQALLGVMMPVLTDASTDLSTKIDEIVNRYIDLLTENPDLPLFVLSEIRNNPERFVENMRIRTLMLESVFVKQIQEVRPDVHPLQILMSIMGMAVFPFVASPLFKIVGGLNQDQFIALMNQRRVLIPAGIKAMLNLK